MYVDTITLFNRFYDNGKLYWRATVLPYVDLNADKAKIRQTYGETSGDNAMLHIAYTGKNRVQNVVFVNPKDYALLGDTSGYITFNSGDKFDFFMNGAWTGNSIIEDEGYPKGFFDYMKKHKDEVYAITSYAKYSVIPHFEVTGK
ncbi:MAG: hypothetical protein IKE23_07040 [Exiguobacterium sp.]|nr:hypothetical protein [Exiguobacterium sp.]